MRTYIGDWVAGFLLYPLQLGALWIIWSTLYRVSGTGSLGLYSLQEIIAYYFGLLVLSRVIGSVMGTENIVWKDVIRGDLNQYLVRPLSYPAFLLARALNKAVIKLVLGAVLVVVCLAITAGYVDWLRRRSVSADGCYGCSRLLRGVVPVWSVELSHGAHLRSGCCYLAGSQTWLPSDPVRVLRTPGVAARATGWPDHDLSPPNPRLGRGTVIGHPGTLAAGSSDLRGAWRVGSATRRRLCLHGTARCGFALLNETQNHAFSQGDRCRTLQ